MRRVQADAVLNRPLALSAARTAVLQHTLKTAGVTALFDDSDGFWTGAPLWKEDGIAVIGIKGLLLAGQGGWGYPYVTFYGDVQARLEEALNDASMKAIVLYIDSPGGMVSGLYDLADRIFDARNIKPITAVLADEAYSAAYAIASSAEKITVPRTGGTGSIGVLMLHTDFSRMLDQAGINVTVFRYGEHKAELLEVEPLTDGARDRAQETIDRLGEMFVDLVARNRGLDPQKIRDMKAETFLGDDGVKLGLADAVMSPDAALIALRDALN
ncbi:S49 family peptidase [Acetobacter musti]|uniref:S49 family peptidase n=1 Tax=Acetobacter musti TaxID=864732 RepID=A0ABX0JNI4_9PROT|nr:S49 family peptidase [Acetobacter musti]NHN83658.1 S49 family peptidase [Acetobacter musti]